MTFWRRPEETVPDARGGRGRPSTMGYTDEVFAGVGNLPGEVETPPLLQRQTRVPPSTRFQIFNTSMMRRKRKNRNRGNSTVTAINEPSYWRCCSDDEADLLLHRPHRAAGAVPGLLQLTPQSTSSEIVEESKALLHLLASTAGQRELLLTAQSKRKYQRLLNKTTAAPHPPPNFHHGNLMEKLAAVHSTPRQDIKFLGLRGEKDGRAPFATRDQSNRKQILQLLSTRGHRATLPSLLRRAAPLEQTRDQAGHERPRATLKPHTRG